MSSLILFTSFAIPAFLAYRLMKPVAALVSSFSSGNRRPIICVIGSFFIYAFTSLVIVEHSFDDFCEWDAVRRAKRQIQAFHALAEWVGFGYA